LIEKIEEKSQELLLNKRDVTIQMINYSPTLVGFFVCGIRGKFGYD